MVSMKSGVKTENLRSLFNSNKIVRVVGAHNGLTAKLVERNGFEAVWASGFEIATAYAVPDANILTMSDLIHVSEVINDSTTLPVVVDCDTGFGNSINVITLVKKLEKIGIAAIAIEDKLFPKVNSYIPGRQELASIAEFSGKIIAAKSAQEDPNFMVIARVEALISGWGMDEALKRAEIYEKAGADAIFIHSKKETPNEIIEFSQRWHGRIPLVICPTSYPQMHEAEIKKFSNIKAVIYANHGLRASIKAINEVLSEIDRLGGIHTINDKIAPMKEAFELQGMFAMKDLEEKYTFGSKDVTVLIPAAGKGGDESLREFLADRPVCLLDIGGKTIIKRNLEILNSLGLSKINITTGYKPNLFKELQDVSLIENPDYSKTNVLSSIMMASEKVSERMLVLYSDIVFEKEIIEKLLQSEADITLVIDSSYLTNNSNRIMDFVLAKRAPIIGDRILRDEKFNEIIKIGKKKVSLGEANFEYIGIALLSQNIFNKIKGVYGEYKNSGNEFQGRSSIDSADFVDMVQELIDQGVKVSALEVHKGWSEVYSFKDYKQVCSMLR